MTRWNPSNPGVAGDEWFGAAMTLKQLGALAGRGPSLVATASQSIDTLATIVRGLASGPIGMAVDVYDLANPVGPDMQSWALAVPVSNASSPSGWVKSTSGVETAYDANAYQNVDEVVLPGNDYSPGITTQLHFDGTTTTSKPILFHAGSTFVDGDTGAGGATITGKRISSVEVVVVVENQSGHSVQMIGELNIGGTSYAADTGPQILGPNSPLTRLRFAWYWNPATGLPWCNADAVALTNGTDAFGTSVTIKSGGQILLVTSVLLQFRVLTERRVATGNAVTNPADRWVEFLTRAVADNSAAVWAKVTGHTYLFLYSLTKGAGPAAIPLIDTSVVAGHPADPLTGADARAWFFDHSAVPLYEIENLEGQMPTLCLIAGVASVDSLPYADVVVQSLGGGTITQRISNHSTQAYGSARLLVGRGAGGQTAGLVIRLKKVSDNSVLAGPVTIAPADVPTDGKFHQVTVVFAAPAALTAGQAVYIEATDTTTTPWLLPALWHHTLSMSPIATDVAAASAQGIGGTTDFADGDTTLDYPWSIIVSPAAPGGLASSHLTIPNRPALAGGGVGLLHPQPATIGYVHLAWTATALGGAFDHYEIQRQSGAVWNTVARVSLEASNWWNDVEGPRGTVAVPVARAYRIRVVNIDGGISVWANFPAVSLAVGDCADVVCASNFDPGSALAFRDLTPTQTWDQRQTARGQLHDILGRELPVAFWPAEAGGESFPRRLAIAFNDPAVTPGGAVTPGRAVFDPVIGLLQNRTLPYIAYSDSNGEEWLTSPSVQSPGPTRDEPNGRYALTVVFAEVADTPVPVDVDVPWVP